MILSMCEEPTVLQVMRLINIIIMVIHIIVPIILIVSMMIQITKSVASKTEEELPKVIKSSVTKAIVATVIFLLPVFVSFIFSVASNDVNYKKCLEVRTKEDIYEAYSNKAEKLIQAAEESLDRTSYSSAYNYLSNVKDKSTKEEFKERLEIVKKKIEEIEKKPSSGGNNPSYTPSDSTDYGKDIPITDTIRTACKWVLNQDTYQVKLKFCDAEHQYGFPLTNPQGDLPGGATFYDGTWHANNSIPFSQYRRGMFFGEIAPLDPGPRGFLLTFQVMYTNVFLFNNLSRLNSQTIEVFTGECNQLYLHSLYSEYYASGTYRSIIDDVADSTKYYIIVNPAGGLIDVRYNTTSGILQVMRNAASQGKDIQGILDAMKSGHTKASFYQGATLFDCRNIDN